MSGKSFRESFDYRRRFAEAERIKKKYPARVPVIVETKPDVPPLSKHKYLVPRDLTVGEFIYVLRNRIKLRPEQALYLFFNSSVIAPAAAMLGVIYENHKDSDQFLYANLCMENTFG